MAPPHRSPIPAAPILSLLLLLAAAAVTAATVGRPRVGGWAPIADPSDPHVQGLGRFAVDEHNNKTGSGLAFDRVVSGQTQVVAGVNYRLLINATDAGAAHTYEAVVWEKPWEGFRQLTSFQLKA